jgi:hypothetical protein
MLYSRLQNGLFIPGKNPKYCKRNTNKKIFKLPKNLLRSPQDLAPVRSTIDLDQSWNRSDFFRPDWAGRSEFFDRTGPAGPNFWLSRQKTGKKPVGHNSWFYRCKTGAFHASFKQLVLSGNSFLHQIDEDIYCQSHNSWRL